MPYLLFADTKGRRLGREISQASLIGRDASCDIHIPNPRLSSRHCRFAPTREGWIVEDLNSRNGTLFEGTRVERRLLAEGNVLRIGDITVIFFEHMPANSADDIGLVSALHQRATAPDLETELLSVLNQRDDDTQVARLPEEEDDEPKEKQAEPAKPQPNTGTMGAGSVRGDNLWKVALDLANAPPTKTAKGKKENVNLKPGAAGNKPDGELKKFIPPMDKKLILTMAVVGMILIGVILEFSWPTIQGWFAPSDENPTAQANDSN